MVGCKGSLGHDGAFIVSTDSKVKCIPGLTCSSCNAMQGKADSLCNEVVCGGCVLGGCPVANTNALWRLVCNF